MLVFFLNVFNVQENKRPKTLIPVSNCHGLIGVYKTTGKTYSFLQFFSFKPLCVYIKIYSQMV